MCVRAREREIVRENKRITSKKFVFLFRFLNLRKKEIKKHFVFVCFFVRE